MTDAMMPTATMTVMVIISSRSCPCIISSAVRFVLFMNLRYLDSGQVSITFFVFFFAVSLCQIVELIDNLSRPGDSRPHPLVTPDPMGARVSTPLFAFAHPPLSDLMEPLVITGHDWL